jgi:tRNA A-37 threonylcarbamoyl transferase component Bud32
LLTESPTNLEEILKDLPRHGTLVKDRGYRQVWRFELAGRPYYLKFYPRRGLRLKRVFRGNPAMREFLRLQQLQKSSVPAPRPANVMVGFTLNGQLGDAVVIEGIEPSVRLDQYLSDFKLRGEPIPDHSQLAERLQALVGRLGRARLGHADLHLGNMLLRDGELFLLDGYAVRPGGLRMNDLLLLGHSVNRFATRTDLYRAWSEWTGNPLPPAANRVSKRRFRKFVERATEENDWFGRVDVGPWHGFFFKKSKFPRRWAPASALSIQASDWQLAWPRIFEQMRAGNLTPLKRSRSGDVWAAQATVGGRVLDLVIKRPFKRYWYRYVNEIGRGSRARRAWGKAWTLIARNIPTAWPLLMLEKRTLGYVTDSIIVFERVPGATLAAVDLDAMDAGGRASLFFRTGRILRQIEFWGYSHFDAKSSNWIISADEKLGARPILIDVDGIRHRRWIALGIDRLLRSMREHGQYTPKDSLDLCQGYSPWARRAG